MINCNILDCTLRDGGYINNFIFGQKVIKDIIKKLSAANTDIIECGFLKSGAFDSDKALYGSIESIEQFITPKSENSLYVGMIAYGDISADEISKNNGKSIDGIRVTFHQSELEQAFELGKQLMDKNYKVFMQPVGTTSYNDFELLELVKKVNELSPYGFYMVDTLGTMFNNDVRKMFCLIDDNLNEGIKIGFHSHNNRQLSFSNAIELLSIETQREVIIDSSVFGMGRGAGNLCTELIMEYINKKVKNKYDIIPVLEIYDEHINKILLKYKWGYSLPYFLASSNNCHPNYARHLINKRTMSIKQISHLLTSMDESKKVIFDKEYIEKLYIAFQKRMVDDSEVCSILKDKLKGRNIVIIAPGKSIKTHATKIQEFCRDKNSIVFSVNFIPKDFNVDYLFISNYKRIKNNIEIKDVSNIIVTSNLLDNEQEGAMIINYADYLNEDDIISDNAGLMLMNFLRKIGVSEINLAGFDGFSVNGIENYFDVDYTNSTEYDSLILKTEAISKKIKSLSNSMRINFLTESKYE